MISHKSPSDEGGGEEEEERRDVKTGQHKSTLLFSLLRSSSVPTLPQTHTHIHSLPPADNDLWLMSFCPALLSLSVFFW